MKGSLRARFSVILVVLVIAITIIVSGCSLFGLGSTKLKVNATLPGTIRSPIAAASRSAADRAAGSISIPVEYPAGTAVGTIDLSIAKVVVKEFKIEKEGVEDSSGEFEFSGPYLVDLVAGTMDPEPVAADIPAGTYSQVEFKIDKVEGDERDDSGAALVTQNDPIFGHSIYLEGSYAPTGGTAVPFTYNFDIDAEFQLKGAGETATGFTISDMTANSIIVAFRMRKWFDGIDPAAFAANPGAYSEQLKENIKKSADYGEDKDHDGVLGSDEDDDSDTEDALDD